MFLLLTLRWKLAIKKLLLILWSLAMIGWVQVAEAKPDNAIGKVLRAMIGGGSVAEPAVTSYKVTATFYEPDTQPRNTIFMGSFDYNSITRSVSNLKGLLSESMTGDEIAYPNDNMTWLSLNYQLSSVYDASIGGLLVTTFLKPYTNTFSSMDGGNGWAPGTGYALYSGFPGANPGNAYAMIYVNTVNPLAPLTQAQINKLAYADCAPGGMMGAVCMTGTTEAVYGSLGSMSGYPVSQVITAIPAVSPLAAVSRLRAVSAVPESGTYAMFMAGLGVIGLISRRRRQIH